MGEGNNQFRGAAFGGFNRHDVLSYLATTESEHGETVAQLRAELDKWKRDAEEAKQQSGALEAKLKETEKRRAVLQEGLGKAEEERDKKAEALKQKEQDLSRLRNEFAEMEPKALAYAKIKERAASIEMDAHERAQSTLDEAEKEAVQVQEAYVRCIRKAQGKYEFLRTGLNEAFAKSTVELELICQMFDRITREFDGYDSLLQDLLSQAEEMVRPAENAAFSENIPVML